MTFRDFSNSLTVPHSTMYLSFLLLQEQFHTCLCDYLISTCLFYWIIGSTKTETLFNVTCNCIHDANFVLSKHLLNKWTLINLCWGYPGISKINSYSLANMLNNVTIQQSKGSVCLFHLCCFALHWNISCLKKQQQTI